MNVPKVLALDYGTVRIGVAVSAGTLADPLVILPNDDSIFQTVVQICSENEVELILVGLSENLMAEKTKEFVSELRKHVSIPIIYTDETLSSHTVHQKLLVLKKSTRSGKVDHYAAAEFLQNWLDENY